MLVHRRPAIFTTFKALLGIGLALVAVSARAEIKFAPVVTNTVTGPDNVACVDLDKDGKLDLIGSSGNGCYVMYGLGNGTFEAPVYYSMGANVTEVIAVDVDSDGRLDLVGCASGANAVAVVRSTAVRVFAPRALYTVGSKPYGVAAGDFNGDGFPDLVVTNDDSGTVSFLKNKGNGTFYDKVDRGCGSYPARCVVADFNGDGKLDFATSAYVSNDVNVFFGDGTGGFPTGANYKVKEYPAQIVVGDFNNDGKPDLATANTYGNNTSVLINDGLGHFTVMAAVSAGGYPEYMRAADMDMDGQLDLIVPNGGGATFNIQRNLGGGNMDDPVFFTTPGTDMRSIAIGDFDGDGKPDIAVTDSGHNAVYVYINQTVPVIPPVVSVSIAPSTVLGGANVTGTVTLSSVAGTGGTVVTLSSNRSSVVPPANVVVPEGTLSTDFIISTSPVALNTFATVTGSTLTGSASGGVTINAPIVSDLSISPSSLYGGGTTTGTVFLNGKAPAGGLIVSLSSNNGAAGVGASVTVPAGATAATFSIVTLGVVSKTTVVIKAQYGTSFRTASVYVYASIPANITYNPYQVRGGTSVTATLTLSGKAGTGGNVVNLVSLNPNVLTPDVSSVTVPGGQSSVTFKVTTYPVSALTMGVIKATGNGSSIQIGLKVYPAAPMTITFNPYQAYGGWAVTGTLTLTSAAPAGGLTVALQAQNTAQLTVPASVTVPAGQTSVTFPIQTFGVDTLTVAVIVATANGESIYYGIRLYPAVPLGIKYNPNPVKAGQSVTATLTLNGVAPPGGLVVTIGAETPNAATAPATVTVPAGQSTATFTVTTHPVTQNTLAVFNATAHGSVIHIGFTVVP